MGNTIHGIAELFTILAVFGAGMIWVTKSIKAGQKEQTSVHRQDFKTIKKELKKRVSVSECDRLRSQCPCNQYQKEIGK